MLNKIFLNSSLFNEFVCKLAFFGTRGPLKRSCQKKSNLLTNEFNTRFFLFDEHLKGSKSFKIFFCSTLSEFENFLLCERILINVINCQNETSS
jgi:hypothetical protein